MILWKKINHDWSLYVNQTKIERSHEVVLLGAAFGEKFNFQKHIENICQVANINYVLFNR